MLKIRVRGVGLASLFHPPVSPLWLRLYKGGFYGRICHKIGESGSEGVKKKKKECRGEGML